MTALPPSSSPNPYRPFQPRTNPPAANPRKVRGGEKVETREGLPLAWAGQRLMRLLESVASGAAMTDGVAYARAGQVRSLTTGPGHVSARVQGRVFAAYQVDLRLPVFTHEQWELALAAMAREARHLASLLSGEVPAGIEDVFVPLHLRLFPQDASEVAASCNCGRFEHNTPATPWCKHVACVIAVVADRVSRDPFRVFALRGLAKDDLLERLRQQRALFAARVAGGAGPDGPLGPGTSGAAGTALMIGRPLPAYSPRVPGVGEQPAAPLAHCLDGFWSRPPGVPELELALEPPQVTHPMLRRLGPSPFAAGKFPLVGLLATCYEVIGQRALDGPRVPEVPVSESPPPV